MILPLPSASSADSSRFRKRLAADENRLNASVAGGMRADRRGRQVDELRVVEAVARVRGLAGDLADAGQVAADGHAVVAADRVAGVAAADGCAGR